MLSDESLSVRWFRKDELDDIPVHQSIRLRIEHGFANAEAPYMAELPRAARPLVTDRGS